MSVATLKKEKIINNDILTVFSERIYNSLDAGGETRTIALDISKSIAKATSRKVGSLYRAKCFLTPESILYLYKSTILP